MKESRHVADMEHTGKLAVDDPSPVVVHQSEQVAAMFPKKADALVLGDQLFIEIRSHCGRIADTPFGPLPTPAQVQLFERLCPAPRVPGDSHRPKIHPPLKLDGMILPPRIFASSSPRLVWMSSIQSGCKKIMSEWQTRNREFARGFGSPRHRSLVRHCRSHWRRTSARGARGRLSRIDGAIG